MPMCDPCDWKGPAHEFKPMKHQPYYCEICEGSENGIQHAAKPSLAPTGESSEREQATEVEIRKLEHWILQTFIVALGPNGIKNIEELCVKLRGLYQRGFEEAKEMAVQHRLVKFVNERYRCVCGAKPDTYDIASWWESHIRTLEPKP